MIFALKEPRNQNPTYGISHSEVIPYYSGLKWQLEAITTDESFACMKTVADVILADLNMNVWLMATLLHPSLKVYATSNEVLLKNMKKEIIRRSVKYRVRNLRKIHKGMKFRQSQQRQSIII